MWQYRKHKQKKRVFIDRGHLWQCHISTNRVECWRFHQDWSKGSKAAPNELPVSLNAHRVSLDQCAADLIRSYHSKDFFLAFQKVASASDFVMVQCWICCGVVPEDLSPGPGHGFPDWSWPNGTLDLAVLAGIIWGPSLSATRPPSDRLWSMIVIPGSRFHLTMNTICKSCY